MYNPYYNPQLASKIAASGGGAPPAPYGGQPAPYGAPQGQPYGQQPPQGQGQGQYGGYPPQGGPPGGPHGGYQPPQQQQYQAYVNSHILKECVKDKKIEHMYPDSRLFQIAQDIAGKDPVNTLCAHWGVPQEVGFDFVKLALFDVVFLLDDSGSMRFGDGLIDELKFILGNVAFATGLFDTDGFSVRFMNQDIKGDNIRTEKQAIDIVNTAKFEDVTPLATSLKNKILDPLVYAADSAGTLRKPILIIIITDGRPTDNVHGEFQSHIQRVSDHFQGRGVVSFQIAQVGNDKGAQDFLASLDKDKAIGRLIDCTSNFEMESAEWKSKGLTLTKHHWYTKLLLGSIDSTYDNKDEDSKAPTQGPGGQASPYGGSHGAPPPSQYGAPPHQQYGGPQQGQYGAPPHGGPQHGAPPQPYGAPPQSPYGQPPSGHQHPPGLQAGYGSQSAPLPYGQQPGGYSQPGPYTGQAPPAQYNPTQGPGGPGYGSSGAYPGKK
ncbi:hypothetical protein P167DRAFT_482227 [Morchella conica CCBAS932]|uniref:VWFA domain-containing protein n=1 Tax=Morchella conica CCBAS932 TaxID=1392247 RepID=A0A3N4LD26_9PEZI|nr:hypothetical protein P167DRAFT_482227 [Morchella conica CCBAS932]